MANQEVFRNISAERPSKHRHQADTCLMESTQSSLYTAMQAADIVRQSLTLLRISLDQPGIYPRDPQELINSIDDNLYALIQSKNDQILALKLQIPRTTEGMRQKIQSLPPALRL